MLKSKRLKTAEFLEMPLFHFFIVNIVPALDGAVGLVLFGFFRSGLWISRRVISVLRRGPGPKK